MPMGRHRLIPLVQALLLTSWLGMSATAPAIAAETDQLLQTLQADMAKFDKIATDTKQNVDYMPYVVSTLNGDDLRTQGIENLREALQLVPGVDLAVGMAGVRNPIFRGSNPFAFGQSKLIIDGMVVNDQIFGGYNQYLDMPVQLIHRIEVVRGPGSLLSHVNGYAGSIHVITRANRDDGLKPENTVFASAGSESYRMAGGVAAAQWQGFDVSADLFVLRHDQHSEPTTDRFGTTGTADQSLKNYSLALNLKRGGLRIKGRLADNDSGVSYGQAFSLSEDPSDHLQVRNAMLEIGYGTEVSPGIKADFSLGYLDEQRTLQNKVMPDGYEMTMPSMPPMTITLANGRYFLVDYSERTYSARAELVYTRLPGHTLTLGAALERTGIDDNISQVSDTGLPPTQPPMALMSTDYRRHLSLYADDLWDINEQFALQLGLKLDRYNDVSSQASPRLAMVYRQDDDNIYKLMYTESYREPSWREQYLAMTDTFFRPNLNLQEESVQALEAAYIHKFGETRDLKLNVFHLRNSDQIYAADGRSAYQNNPDTEITGLEVEYHTPVGERGRLSANYSFVDGENVVGSLANSTRHMVKATYSHKISETWTLSGLMIYVGEKDRVPADPRPTVADYATLDLALNYRNRHSGTRLTLAVKNVLDEGYASPAPIGTYADDLAQPGRRFLVNVAQEF